MLERIPIDRKAHAPMQCEEWEVLLADALDGGVSEKDAAAFDTHGRDCHACAELLANARQGQQWLRFLHREPAVPADLVTKILGRTSGTATPQLAGIGAAMPIPVAHVSHFQMQRAFRDSRMLMTAAMAFFSIALTLNLAGVKVTQLRLADLKPSALQSTVSRSFYGTKGELVHYYDNLRVVYEVEARVREIRRDAQTEQQTTPEKQPANKEGARKNRPGSARRNGGRLETPRDNPQQRIVFGRPELADVNPNLNGCPPSAIAAITDNETQAGPLEFSTDDQAEGSLA